MHERFAGTTPHAGTDDPGRRFISFGESEMM